MTIEQYFEAAFVINLSRRTDRYKQFRDDMAASGIEHDFIQRWEGFDNPKDGHSGCTRSHREIIRHIANGPWERVLVFEDDCSPITEPSLIEHGFTPESEVWKTFYSVAGDTVNQKFSSMTRFIPDDWDVLYLGGAYGENPCRRINRHVIKTGLVQTTSSYGITREYAREWSCLMDRHHGPDGFPGQIDNLLCSQARSHNFYMLQPRLFFQRKSYSDLSGTNVSHFNSMTDPVHEAAAPSQSSDPLVCVIIPCRERVDQLVAVIESIRDASTDGLEVDIAVKMDSDDKKGVERFRSIQHKVNARLVISPRLEGWGSINVFATDIADQSNAAWITVWNDDCLLKGKDMHIKLRECPTRGYIAKPDNYQLNTSMYPKTEGNMFPFFPNGSWRRFGYPIMPKPLDSEMDRLLRLENGWKTWFLEGLTAHHRRLESFPYKD